MVCVNPGPQVTEATPGRPRRPCIRGGRCHSAMLMPGMNELDAIVLRHGVGPMHVRIPHEREYGINALRDKGLGEDFIGWQFY
jgi:hypothetical protein